MDQATIEKAKTHEVRHLFTGQRYHFFEVISGESQEEYCVRLELSCTCRYMSVQGIANGKICSHLAAVLNKINQEGGIKHGP